jgi:hypothetical protein
MYDTATEGRHPPASSPGLQRSGRSDNLFPFLFYLLQGKWHPRTGHKDPDREYRYITTLSLI